MSKLITCIGCVMVLSAAGFSPAEDWPGYEGGNLHHNASATDIDLSKLPEGKALWGMRFDNPISCQTTNPGFFGSRNLALVDGKLAVVAAAGREGFRQGVCHVSILSAADGKVLNCISTTQTCGPRRHQMQYPFLNYMEAYDTAIGLTVMHWDAKSGMLLLRNGGDNPGNTAYLPLANAGEYSGSGYTTGRGAYEKMYKEFPNFKDADGNIRADKEIPCDAKRVLDGDQWDYGTVKPIFNNQPNSTAFFEVDADSGLMAAAVEPAHRQAGGYFLLNKHTGLYAKVHKGQFATGKPVFAKWGGVMVGNGRVFFMGPADDTGGDGFNTGLTNPSKPDQGLSVYGFKVDWQDKQDNGGYDGPGKEETAGLTRAFGYDFHSTEKPDSPEDAGSYLELDAFHRNKAWLVDGQGVWAAWKRSKSASLELLHCDDSASKVYDLGIGSGMRGQDIWPHVSLASVKGSKHIVYYGGNGMYRRYELAADKATSTSAPARQRSGFPGAWVNEVGQPLGPAALAVVNTQTGRRWTLVLNAPDGSGPLASLPANDPEGYFDKSQMLVAGSHVVLAWVNTGRKKDLVGKLRWQSGSASSAASAPAATGIANTPATAAATAETAPAVLPASEPAAQGNATLVLVSFDLSALPDEPTSCLRSYDLGIPKSGNGQTQVTDLIAADGVLYVLVTESDTLRSDRHTWTAQRVIAIGKK